MTILTKYLVLGHQNNMDKFDKYSPLSHLNALQFEAVISQIHKRISIKSIAVIEIFTMSLLKSHVAVEGADPAEQNFIV